MFDLRIQSCHRAYVVVPERDASVTETLLGHFVPVMRKCPAFSEGNSIINARCDAGGFYVHDIDPTDDPPALCPLRSGEGRVERLEFVFSATHVAFRSDHERLKRAAEESF